MLKSCFNNDSAIKDHCHTILVLSEENALYHIRLDHFCFSSPEVLSHISPCLCRAQSVAECRKNFNLSRTKGTTIISKSIKFSSKKISACTQFWLCELGDKKPPQRIPITGQGEEQKR